MPASATSPSPFHVIDALEAVEIRRARAEWIESALRESRPKSRRARRRLAEADRRAAEIAAQKARVHAEHQARADRLQAELPAVLQARFGIPVEVVACTAAGPFGVRVIALIGGVAIDVDPATGELVPRSQWRHGPVSRPGELARYLRWCEANERPVA